MYRSILVATDGSELADRGVAHAVGLAQGLGASLLVVTASEPWNTALTDPAGLVGFDAFLEDYRAASTRHASEVLDAVAEQARTRGVPVETVFVQERPAADAILATADARDVDLIIMASHGRQGLGRLLLGSQTRSVVARSERPVLVVR